MPAPLPSRDQAQSVLAEMYTSGRIDGATYDQAAALLTNATTQHEVDKVLAGITGHATPRQKATRARRVEKVLWIVAMAVFVIGLFVFEWRYSWIAFVVAAVVDLVIKQIIKRT